MSLSAESLSRFTFHKPDADGITKMRSVRKWIRGLASEIETICPPGKEREAALQHLQLVMMSANSAIVQQYPLDENDFG